MPRAGDLMIRVKFAGTDRLSRMLENISGKSSKAGRAIAETNRTLQLQKRELSDVQRQIAKADGSVTGLIEREHALEIAIVRVTRQMERQTRIAQINARTHRAGEVGRSLVASGQGEFFSTAAMAAPLFLIAKAGAEFQSLQNRMRILGLGNGAVNELTDFARAMDIAGSSVNENMRYLLEAQGVFRESGEHNLADQLSGAKLMAPLLAKMHVVAESTGKALSEDQERYFLRFIEQAGGLASPKRAADLTNGLFRALQSSGGNVQASDYQSFLARAGVAGSHLSTQSMFADFEPLIAELHEQAGVGLSTGMKAATGIKANSRAAAEFLKLGLWDRSKVNFNSLGGVKSTNGNPLKGPAADALAHSPIDFYRNFVMPAYDRAGIKTAEGRAFENAKLFGGTGGNLFSLIDKQLPTILRSRLAYRKTQNLDQAYNQTNDSFFGQEGKLRSAGKDFMIAAGTKGGLLDNVVSLMQSATVALRAFTAFGNAHPKAFSWLGTIVTDLVLLRGGLAVAKIAFGGLLGPVAQIVGVWSKIRAAGSFAEVFPTAARIAVPAFNAIRTAAIFMGEGMLRAGALMLANPMVLAIVAIGAAIGVVAFLVYRNWDKIKGAFVAGWNWLKGLVPMFKNIGAMMMDGLLSMLDPARLAGHLINMGKGAVNAFKNVLGIHSPSRVFHEVGGFMMKGLHNGIDANAGEPVRRMTGLSRQLTTAIAIGAAVPASASAGTSVGTGARVSGDRYEIHLHAGPGMDETRMVAMLERKLAEIERRKQMRARSSYRDDPDHGAFA